MQLWISYGSFAENAIRLEHTFTNPCLIAAFFWLSCTIRRRVSRGSCRVARLVGLLVKDQCARKKRGCRRFLFAGMLVTELTTSLTKNILFIFISVTFSLVWRILRGTNLSSKLCCSWLSI